MSEHARSSPVAILFVLLGMLEFAAGIAAPLDWPLTSVAFCGVLGVYFLHLGEKYNR